MVPRYTNIDAKENPKKRSQIIIVKSDKRIPRLKPNLYVAKIKIAPTGVKFAACGINLDATAIINKI